MLVFFFFSKIKIKVPGLFRSALKNAQSLIYQEDKAKKHCHGGLVWSVKSTVEVVHVPPAP